MKRTKSTILRKNKSGNSFISIVDHAHTEVTREVTEDQWDADDTSTSHNIVGFNVSEKNQFYDLIVPYEIKDNTDYFLVYVIYSDGDSFSHHEGNIIFIDMFTSRERADALVKAIEEDYEKNPNFSFKFINSKGLVESLYCSWKGYFESLDSASVEVIRKI